MGGNLEMLILEQLRIRVVGFRNDGSIAKDEFVVRFKEELLIAIAKYNPYYHPCDIVVSPIYTTVQSTILAKANLNVDYRPINDISYFYFKTCGRDEIFQDISDRVEYLAFSVIMGCGIDLKNVPWDLVSFYTLKYEYQLPRRYV